MSLARVALASLFAVIATATASCVDGPDVSVSTLSFAGAAGQGGVDQGAGGGSSGSAGSAGDAGASGHAAASGAIAGSAGISGHAAAGAAGDSGSSSSGSAGVAGAAGIAGSAGASSGAAGSAGSSGGDAGAAGFMTATHADFPSVVPHNGPTYPTPELVLVGYMDDPHASDLDSWATWIVTSEWLTSVGADYGITSATYAGSAVIPTAAPIEISDAEIQEALLNRIADGTIPAPSAQTILLYYLPKTSLVFLGGETSCTNFGGYHASINSGATNLAYAVLPTCPAGQFGPTETAGLEVVASHETIEAATDPYVNDSPAWGLDPKAPSYGAWAWVGGEVADLCAHQPISYGDDWVQRVWSISSAALGQDPCVPNPKGQPYFNASVVGDAVKTVQPGDTVVFDLVGFSLEPVPDWTIDTQEKTRDFDVKLELDGATLNNGKTVHLSVQVPADAASGASCGFVIRSLRGGDTDDYAMWPMAVVIPN